MRHSIRTLLCGLSLLCAAPQVAGGFALYATGHNGPDGPSTFYRLIPTPAVIGPIGFERVGAVDSHPFTQRIYACGERFADGTPVLLEIDPLTGAGSEIGPTGMSGAISDIAFRPSDGKLFAHVATPGVHALHTIDLATGAATLVGFTGAVGSGNGIEFSPDGRLWLYAFNQMYVLDQTTGQATYFDDLDYSPLGSIAAVDFGNYGSVMYMVIKAAFPTVWLALGYAGEAYVNYVADLGQNDIDGICFASRPFGYATSGTDGGASDLYRVDLTTGETSLVGPTGFHQVGAIDFNAGVQGFRPLYGTGVDPLTNEPVLITIDPVTGKGTRVGLTGIAPHIGDLSALTASGRMAGWQPLNDPDQSLFQFDVFTGAASLIGNTGLIGEAGNGLAEVPLNATLHHASHASLHVINTLTGAATLLGPLTYLPPLNTFNARPPAMDYNENGSLYALCRQQSGVQRLSLAAIDVPGRTIRSLGDTGVLTLDGFAVRTDASPLLEVEAPDGGETYGIGTTQPITWNPFDDPTTPTVEITYTTGVELYAATSESPVSSLYRIDLTTGAATLVQSMGYARVGGMVTHPITGALYATSYFGTEPILAHIDPETAYANRLGGTFTQEIGDLAWRESDHTVFAYNVFNNPGHSLWTMNTQMGKATLVGPTGLASSGGNALEFVGNTLYHSNRDNLHTLNTSTGQATVVAPMSFQAPFVTGNARLGAMKRHPGTGVVYCLVKGGSGGATTYLGTVDLATGVVTNIGDTGVGTLDGMAFVPGPWNVIATTTPNDGSYSWFVPNTPTNLARVRIRGGDRFWMVGEDLSDRVFSIQDITAAPVRGAALALLGPVSPNPAHEVARVSYSVSRPTHVRLTVHDVQGRLVSTLVDGRVEAGPHAIAWDGRDTAGRTEPTGMYWMRLEVDGGAQTRRFTRIR